MRTFAKTIRMLVVLNLKVMSSMASAETLNAFAAGVQSGAFSEIDVSHFKIFSRFYTLIPIFIFGWIFLVSRVAADNYDGLGIALSIIVFISGVALGSLIFWGAERLYVGENADALRLANTSIQIQGLDGFLQGIDKVFFSLEDVSNFLFADKFIKFFWIFVVASLLISPILAAFNSSLNGLVFFAAMSIGLLIVRSYLTFFYVGGNYDALEAAALINMAQTFLK